MNKHSALVWIPVFLCFWVFALYAHLDFGAFESKIALSGFSALDFANTVLFPENFSRDYPGGAWMTGKSIVSWVHPFSQYLGIPEQFTYAAMVALEIALLSYGAMHLARTLSPELPGVALLTIAVVFALSWLRLSNLGQVSSPFFHGQFYGFADGLRLLAISYYLRGQYAFSSLSLILGMTVHPIKTLFGFAFIGMATLYKSSDFVDLRRHWPYLVFGGFAVVWILVWLGLGTQEQPISSPDFFRYSPLLNSHWYPQHLGILTFRHIEYMTPFLGAAVVYTALIIRIEAKSQLKIQLAYGLAGIVLVSITGLVIAWNELSATLVKVSAQRASLLVLSITGILLIAQSVKDITSGRWWYAAHGFWMVAIAFASTTVWPLLVAIVYAVSVLLESSVRRRHRGLSILLVGLLLLSLGYQAYLFVLGYQKESNWSEQLALQIVIALTAGTLVLFSRWIAPVKRILANDRLLQFSLVILLAIGAHHWGDKYKTLSTAYIEQGQEFKAVQLWARDNTPKDALFMLDPCHAYGWRDYSKRSSFGSIHEWYKTGWLYSGDQSALVEGIERGRRLGIEIDDILAISERPPYDSYPIMCEIVRQNFYAQSGDSIPALVRDYRIDYVVMDREQASVYGTIPPWEISFQNDYYVVLVPPDLAGEV